MIGTPVRVAVLRAAAAALISTAAACSSSSTPADQSSAVPSSASVAARAPPTGTSTATHDAFAQCLSDNGVPAPPGGGHAGGPPPNGPCRPDRRHPVRCRHQLMMPTARPRLRPESTRPHGTRPCKRARRWHRRHQRRSSPDMERPPSRRTWLDKTEGLGGRVAAGNSPARAGDSPGAASSQPPHMSVSQSIGRTTSFLVYERPYSRTSAATTDF